MMHCCVCVCMSGGVGGWDRKLQVIYSTNKQKPLQTLIYPSVCVGESTKQQRGDDVPHQTLCSVGGLLNALTGSHCKRALHLSAASFLFPCSCLHYHCHQIATVQEKATEWSPCPTFTTRVRKRERARENKKREGRDGLVVLNAGSKGAVTEGWREKEKWKRDRNGSRYGADV